MFNRGDVTQFREFSSPLQSCLNPKKNAKFGKKITVQYHVYAHFQIENTNSNVKMYIVNSILKYGDFI